MLMAQPPYERWERTSYPLQAPIYTFPPGMYDCGSFTPRHPVNWWSLWAIGLATLWLYWVGTAAGLVLAVVGLARADRVGGHGKTMAWWAIGIALTGVVLGVAVAVR